MLIPALTTIVHMVIAAAWITVTAPFLFKAPMQVNWLNFLIVFAALVVACAGISVLIGVVSASSRTTVLWLQFILSGRCCWVE